jgi:hypothetical protein
MTDLPALREAAGRVNLCGCPGAYRGMLCHACVVDARRLALALPALVDELEALKARTCETCRHRVPPLANPMPAICGACSIPGHSVAIVMCKTLGFTCGSWAKKEQA